MSATGLRTRRWLADPASLRASGTAWAVAISVLGSLVWLAATPHVPDLAAQVARARLVDRVGVSAWWPGWFGGVTLPDYSVIGPWVMATIGVRGAGASAAVAGSVAFARLTSGAFRPRAGAVAFALAGLADVLDGRITFAIGLALGAWTLVGLQSVPQTREGARRRATLIVLGAVGTFLASPLAGLFLGIALVAAALTTGTRWLAVVGAAPLVVLAGAFALLFPGTGVMPFHPSDIIPAALGCIGVLVLCPERTLRVGAGLVLVTSFAVLAVPSAIGTNITRIVWVAAAALAVAHCRLRALPAFVLSLSLAIWPVADLTRQLSRGASPSASSSFYAPLADALSRAGAVPSSGQRLEIVDSGDHWAVADLPDAPALARGWDRQADAADNPIFYTAGALDAQTYHDWLRQLAVGWVAVPNVAHDYASVTEARLVDRGLTYLQLAWASRDWRLYRVIDATPLADGATVEGVGGASLTLAVPAAGDVPLRVRWSAHLTVRTVGGAPAVGACLRDDAGWLTLVAPRRGTYRVVSRFDPLAPLAGGQVCVG